MNQVSWLTVVFSGVVAAIIAAVMNYFVHQSQKRERYREILIPEKLKDYRIINETFVGLITKCRSQNIDQMIEGIYEAIDVARAHSLLMPITFFTKINFELGKTLHDVENLRKNEEKNYEEIIKKLQEVYIKLMIGLNQEFSGGLLAITPKPIVAEILNLEEDIKFIGKQLTEFKGQYKEKN